MPRTQCYAEKRGKLWRGRYPDTDGHMRSTSGYPTRTKALDAARVEQAKALADTAAGQSGPPQGNADPEGKELTLAEWFDRIWQSWDIELTTRANYSAPIRRFILPAFGSSPLSSITREAIDQWERVLVEERGYSVEYIRGARSRLHTILADAVAAGHLAVNPAARRRGRGRKASQERARASTEKIWATENIALLVAERCGLLGGADEFARTVVMAATGMRWGEVNGLQASYVRRPDQRRSHHYIRVEWQLIELNGKFYLAPPKDGSRRDIDIPAWLFDLIHTVIAHARRCRCPLNENGTSACGSTEEFVFLGSRAGARPQVQLRNPHLPARLRRNLPRRETPPRLPDQAMASPLHLGRPVSRSPGADRRPPPRQGRGTSRLLMDGHHPRPHTPRPAPRPPDLHAPRPRPASTPPRAPRPRPLRRHLRPLHPHRRRDDRRPAHPPDTTLGGRSRGESASRCGRRP